MGEFSISYKVTYIVFALDPSIVGFKVVHYLGKMFSRSLCNLATICHETGPGQYALESIVALTTEQSLWKVLKLLPLQTLGKDRLLVGWKYFMQTPTTYTGLRDKPHGYYIFSNWLCRKIKIWKCEVFCFEKNKSFAHCINTKYRLWNVVGLSPWRIIWLIFDTIK